MKSIALFSVIGVLLVSGCTGQTFNTAEQDCGSDLQCFSDATKTCAKAKVLYDVALLAKVYYNIEGNYDEEYCKGKSVTELNDGGILLEHVCYIPKGVGAENLKCLSPEDIEGKLKSQTIVTKDLSELALRISDIPVGYKITDTKSDPKLSSYSVTFSKEATGYFDEGGTIINQLYSYQSIADSKAGYEGIKNIILNNYSEADTWYDLGDEQIGGRIVDNGIELFEVVFRKNNIVSTVMIGYTGAVPQDASSYAKYVEQRIENSLG